MFPSCDSHSIATCPLNAEYKRRAQQWSRSARTVHTCGITLSISPYLFNPFPNLGGLCQDIRSHRDIGAEGIF